MAPKRPRPPRGPSADAVAGPTGSPSAAATPSSDGRSPDSSPRPVRREIRPFFYAGLDIAMAAIYAALITQAPTRHVEHAALLWGAVGAVLVAGLGMLWRSRWGWRAAVAGCAVLLLLAVVLLVLILLSASFLAGVYGSMGRGAATMALLVGALVIELVALLPAFQLKFLLTRAGRRHYGRAAEPAR